MSASRIAAALALLTLAACSNPAPNSAAAPSSNATPANAAAAAPSTAAGDADAVKAYVASLYAHYKTSKDNNFNPYGANGVEVFDADMLGLLAEDTKLLKGDEGNVESDYLCACQDFGSLTATVTVQSATSTTAKASVEVSDLTMPKEGPRHVAIDLVKVGDTWRIHDIADPPDITSLRKTLIDEIAMLKAHPEAEAAVG